MPDVSGNIYLALTPQLMDALEADNEFLKAGGVFTDDLIEMYVGLKRGDVDALRLRPHPYEFQLYFDF